MELKTNRQIPLSAAHGEHLPKTKDMSLASRGNSFIYAFNGIKLLLTEPNIKLHLAATCGVIAAGLARHIAHGQWIAILLAIALVWITEALNTCIEKLCDYSCNNQWSAAIKTIKDMAAGAVLIASVTSTAIGIIVFFFWN